MFEFDCRGRGVALGGLALFVVIGSGCSSEDSTRKGFGGIEALGSSESAGASDQASQALVNETCYPLRAHGWPQGAPYTLLAGEDGYVQFHYSLPWSVPMVATRFVTEPDNWPVVRSWELFKDYGGFYSGPPGSVISGVPYQTETELIASWVVGEGPLEMPPGVGLELPSFGQLALRWSYFNSTGVPQTDASVVQICAVPAGTLAHTASITLLGTENIQPLPLGMSQHTGFCTSHSPAPITVFLTRPHMHLLGINTRTSVHRSNQPPDVVRDEPFDFLYQPNYATSITLGSGDRIESACVFNNTSGALVHFGQSLSREVCYHYTYSYPAGALENGASSLLGATNTCW